jgi:TPR repeat protein
VCQDGQLAPLRNFYGSMFPPVSAGAATGRPRSLSSLPTPAGAADSFAAAAAEGDADAQFNLASCYMDGVHGVARNPAEVNKEICGPPSLRPAKILQ